MTPKTLKTINSAFWAIVALVLDIMVVYYWHQMGCGVKSLVLGCIQFTAFCACFWYCIHNHINEANR